MPSGLEIRFLLGVRGNVVDAEDVVGVEDAVGAVGVVDASEQSTNWYVVDRDRVVAVVDVDDVVSQVKSCQPQRTHEHQSGS